MSWLQKGTVVNKFTLIQSHHMCLMNKSSTAKSDDKDETKMQFFLRNCSHLDDAEQHDVNMQKRDSTARGRP